MSPHLADGTNEPLDGNHRDRGGDLATGGRRPTAADRDVEERAGERGAATVVGVAAVLVVLAAFAVAVQLGAAVITRHRAEAAADLAALAAAARVTAGPADACASARRVTDRMVVRMEACELDGWEVTVRVEASPPGLLGRFGTSRAIARAGPALVGGTR